MYVPTSFSNFLSSWKLVCYLSQYVVADGIQRTDLQFLARTTTYIYLYYFDDGRSGLSDSAVQYNCYDVYIEDSDFDTD